ncbi:MAG: DNA replication and repair protein RecF [Bacteriovoracaceae bacterium]|nr:DNA replication and repair protein RecF [Bacteriovoracaceae bacterium]
MNYKISKLQVTNFRNLNPDIITFSNGINCILGENGNGKTNILEAINVLATKKSFRKNTSFPQFLSIDGGKPEIIFYSVIAKNNENLSYSSKMSNEGVLWFLDGIPVKKKLDIKVIFINPFDSYGFHNSASERREWIDYFLCQLDEQYKKALAKYTIALRFRNTLLSKKPSKYKEQINASDKELSELCVYLTNKRIELCEIIEPIIGETFQALFSEKHMLKITLDSRIAGMSAENVLKMLKNNLETDCERCHTSYGPHKDDYVLLFDGLNSFDYCSLGQQKMSYLSLLFAYIELFRYKYMSYPIVLIDDVSGELDQHRWRRLVEYLEKREFQVLITTANEKFKEELDRIIGANNIHIKNGSIIH